MAVRKTESRIPRGFENANDLGPADIVDNKFALIAKLPGPLSKLPDQKLKNEYFVFVDTSKITEKITKYLWTIDFYSPSDTDELPTVKSMNDETNIGYLSLEIPSNCLKFVVLMYY